MAESAGLTLVDMAVAFVVNHPAVTSAIIGPRTMEQLESQLGAADVDLDADVLDAIDEIVPPGSNSSANDGGYDPPSITDASAPPPLTPRCAGVRRAEVNAGQSRG